MGRRDPKAVSRPRERCEMKPRKPRHPPAFKTDIPRVATFLEEDTGLWIVDDNPAYFVALEEYRNSEPMLAYRARMVRYERAMRLWQRIYGPPNYGRWWCWQDEQIGVGVARCPYDTQVFYDTPELAWKIAREAP